MVKQYSYLRTEKKIKIMDKDTNAVIDYDPDYVIKKHLSIHTYYFIVFEIIDKQGNEKTIADLARILATPEIRKAVFISCSEKKKKETDEIISAILGSYKDRFQKRNKKELIDISSKLISPSDSEETLEKMVMAELKPFLKQPKPNQT